MASYGIHLALGEYDATVDRTEIVALGQRGTPAVRVYLVAGGESIDTVIWISEKSMGIARQALKAIGFDPDQSELSVLDDEPEFLRGQVCRVAIIEDDYGGKLTKKCEIVTYVPKKRVPKSSLSKLTRGLRDAGSDESKAKASEGGRGQSSTARSAGGSPAASAPASTRAPSNPMDFDEDSIPF